MFLQKVCCFIEFIQDSGILLTIRLQITVPHSFYIFSSTLMTHFGFLHHGDEGNTFFEASGFSSVTLFNESM